MPTVRATTVSGPRDRSGTTRSGITRHHACLTELRVPGSPGQKFRPIASGPQVASPPGDGGWGVMGVREHVSHSLCIFCGRRWGEVKKSEEHVFGHLRHRPGDLRNERTSCSTGLAFDVESQQFIFEPVTSDERPSSLLNLRTRRVCEPCNIGWMHRLEDQAKPPRGA